MLWHSFEFFRNVVGCKIGANLFLSFTNQSLYSTQLTWTNAINAGGKQNIYLLCIRILDFLID